MFVVTHTHCLASQKCHPLLFSLFQIFFNFKLQKESPAVSCGRMENKSRSWKRTTVYSYYYVERNLNSIYYGVSLIEHKGTNVQTNRQEMSCTVVTLYNKWPYV